MPQTARIGNSIHDRRHGSKNNGYFVFLQENICLVTNIFVSKYLENVLFHLYAKYAQKNIMAIFWTYFFGCPNCSKSTKTHLDVALVSG